VYHEGFGSTLIRETKDNPRHFQDYPRIAMDTTNRYTQNWPAGDLDSGTIHGIDSKSLKTTSNNLFAGHRYHGRANAFLVLYRGRIAEERYRDGFDKNTRFPSWSMAKSFMNTIAGIMSGDSLLNIDGSANLQEWKNDQRNEITIKDLMQMQSGLQWNEDYGNRSDVTRMLYTSGDFARYAMDRPLVSEPGSNWYYSSGSTNIVSFIMRRKFASDSAYLSYPYTRFFNRTGMQDVVFETDATGTFAGSSSIYASARDYARFGLLYLNDGIANGIRILPPGWVAFSTTPAIHSQGNYGAFFWLNKGGKYPSAPADMYYCNGYNGQRIFMVPSQNMVVVILGHSPKPDDEMDFDLLLSDILKTK
jgi:CubicO group peptidase (beta-lactamase class C family)